ncbi:MAG: hypothetical protein ACFE8A_01915 [Candidatus Hodarchaeota archaeon]
MSMKNPYKPANVKLDNRKKIIWLISLFGCGIYAIIVLIVLFFLQIPTWVELIIIYSYMVIGPLTIYTLWLLLFVWKTKKWPMSEKLVGGRTKFLLMLFLMGICVINFAAYWNSGIDYIWYIAAIGVLIFTKDEILASVIYVVGAIAITPAFVEEFLKAFPSILAFFVVLQRNRNSEQKGKGMLGNELNGFLFGMIIGITFEILELISYLISTIVSGGGAFDIYLQVTIRNWAPIHILGGSLGGFAAGRAERLRFERGEENLPMGNQFKKFLKRFIPLWLIPVSIHFLWNSSSVWIILYVYSINAQATLLAEILLIIIYIVLGTLSYALLLIFLMRANSIAKKTYRCPETGIIVANEDIVCTTFSDKYTSEYTQFSPRSPAKFCVNCGKPVKFNARFCIYCGFNLKQINLPLVRPKLYEGFTIALFIITLIVAILFLVYSLVFFILILIIYGMVILIPLVFQTSVQIITIGLMIFAVITLLKLRKDYDGRKSIWGWMILIFNLFGMFGILLIYGIYGMLYGSLALMLGYIYYYMILVVLFLAGAAIIFTFLLLVIINGQQTIQYQRKF